MCIFFVQQCTAKNKYSHNQPFQKWLSLDQLDNGSYSTIQHATFTTYNMKIGVYPALLEFLDFLESIIDNNHWIESSSPATNPSGVLTNINLT